MDSYDENNEMVEQEIQEDRELIYNEDSGFHNVDKLFNDESHESAIYEIEFKIYDKITKNVRYVKVELEKINYQKPYFGGFVNKTNGSYYYHSYAQTDQYKNPHIIRNEREVQTYQYKTRSTKMNREFGTQMQYVGLYIDPNNDKILVPTKYFDADTWELKKESTVLYLQKMMRGFLARKLASLYRKERDDQRKSIEKKDEEQRLKEELENKREIERRTHPKSVKDFVLLKKELETWVANETLRIKSSNLSEEDKTLALQELLHKEISLLQTIEKLKISANKENKTEKIQQFLKKMSADKKWKRHDGHYINVATVLTKTAEKLEEQFKNLNSSATVDIRLKNLLEFKKLMESYYEEHKCSLIQQIISLIERESDMLQRGRPDSSLEGID